MKSDPVATAILPRKATSINMLSIASSKRLMRKASIAPPFRSVVSSSIEGLLQHGEKSNQTISFFAHLRHIQGNHAGASQRDLYLAGVIYNNIAFKRHYVSLFATT
jgi:hypothetical protein